jgi:dTDP-4-amino-4,6-dideoxygalactose transaminase
MKIIPYGRQYIDTKDIKFVSEALKQDLITTGNYVKKFEKNISKFLKVKFAIACSNGTSAIHLAFMAIDLKKEDVIIMPSINFIAAYNMARLMDAKIFLADVDPLTGQMTPQTLLQTIKRNKLKKIKVILTMYLGGYPENVVEFYNIKKKFNCYLIEDACHALGAKYLVNKKYLSIGSCKHSDISTFSLHPVKTITAGEGGVVTTNNRIIYNKIIHLRSHGIHKDKNFHWKYDVKNISFNYRLSDLNCALGLSQLKKIENFINYRKKIFNAYKASLKKFNHYINFPFYNNNKPSYHLFLISVNFKIINFTKDKLLKFFKKKKYFVSIIIFQFINLNYLIKK